MLSILSYYYQQYYDLFIICSPKENENAIYKIYTTIHL